MMPHYAYKSVHRCKNGHQGLFFFSPLNPLSCLGQYLNTQFQGPDNQSPERHAVLMIGASPLEYACVVNA